MAEMPKLLGAVGGTKRATVDKDKSNIVMIVAGAAALTIVCLVVSWGLMQKGNYYRKVASQQQAAKDTLEANKEAVAKLKSAYESFKSQNPNLLNGSPVGEGAGDGDNAQIILDALPSKYDFPAFVASLDSLMGSQKGIITGTDDNLSQAGAAPGAPLEIPFTISATTSYQDFKGLMDRLNKSIRPLSFHRVVISGDSQSMTVNLDGKTYWQPEQGMSITESEVAP